MNPELEKELAEASGESAYKGVRPLELNELSLNGDGDVTINAQGQYEPKGGYFRKRLIVNRKKDQKPEEVNLGTTVRVILLRKRRKLVERGEKGKILRSTNEHNVKTDSVTLFDATTNTSINGVAADLRERFGGLRTVEVFYSLLLTDTAESELVRFIIKGSSLGSEAKAENVQTIYSYLASFASNEHVWQYITELVPVREQGMKSYYAIDFKRGEKLEEEKITADVAPILRKLRDHFAEIDEARAQRIVEATKAPEQPADDFELPTDETAAQPTPDINPDDIPF